MTIGTHSYDLTLSNSDAAETLTIGDSRSLPTSSVNGSPPAIAPRYLQKRGVRETRTGEGDLAAQSREGATAPVNAVVDLGIDSAHEQ